MNTATPFMIVTSDLSSDSETLNARKRVLLERQLTLRGLEWRRVEGVYQGAHEHGYKVLVPDQRTEHEVLVLAWRYQQESVLHVAANGWATLQFVAGDDAALPGEIKRVEPLGFWRAFEPAHEGNVLPESYTRIRYGDHETYFTTRALP